MAKDDRTKWTIYPIKIFFLVRTHIKKKPTVTSCKPNLKTYVENSKQCWKIEPRSAIRSCGSFLQQSPRLFDESRAFRKSRRSLRQVNKTSSSARLIFRRSGEPDDPPLSSVPRFTFLVVSYSAARANKEGEHESKLQRARASARRLDYPILIRSIIPWLITSLIAIYLFRRTCARRQRDRRWVDVIMHF